MYNMQGRLALFSSEHIFEHDGRYLVTQSKLDTLSLQCDPFESVVLAVPKKSITTDVSILVDLPKKYKILALYEMDGEGFFKRVKGVISTIGVFLKHNKDWDVIYIRLFFWDALIAGILSILLKKNMFVSLHGDILEAININWKDRKYPGILKKLTANVLRWLTSWICYKGQVLFVSGPALAEKYTPKRNNAVSFLDSGYSYSDIFIREDTCQNSKINILYVGELVDRKGLRYLLEAIKIIADKNENIVLNIVGEGDEKKYKAIVKSLDIEKKVNFLGYKSFGPQLFYEFKNADIFVLPSIGTEGWSRVLVEANAHSLPIITTEVGSLGHAVRECNCGLIAEVASSKSLAENIMKVIQNGSLRRKLINGSIQRARIHTKENERRLVWDKLYETYPNYILPYEE